MFLAGDDPVRSDILEKDTMINYWALLNKKITDIKKVEAKRKAQEAKTRGRSNHRTHS